MNLKKELFLILKPKKILQCILIAVIPAILFYVISLNVLMLQGYQTREIIKESADLTDSSSFLGFLSNIGIWLWISSASICFFTITKTKSLIDKGQKKLLLLTGLFSILLAIDDFFMIHDRYISQYICYAVYALLTFTILIGNYKTILKTDAFAFFLAGFFLALSVFIDIIQSKIPFNHHKVQVFEEGFKFIGIATWLYFNANAAAYNSKELKPNTL